MNRREFLRISSVLPLMPMLSMPVSAASTNNILILLELKGGNDGLNTLIPYSDPYYAINRPNIAIPESHALVLEQGMAMHPSLRLLGKLWDEGDMAWIQGVGYPNHSESHFHAIDMWDLANPASITDTGWLSHVLPTYGN